MLLAHQSENLQRTNSQSTAAPLDRLLSIDALRGFDMFWIMGGEHVVKAVADWGQWPISDSIRTQLEHVRWEGFRFYDLIYPLFLFIVGVVLPFSLDKHRLQGQSTSRLYWRILRRTTLLVLLGLFANNALESNLSAWRWPGVLQRIGICYGIAAVLMLNTRVRIQALTAAGLLVGYWALLALVPAPGGVAGDYSMENNLAGYVDRIVLPGKLYYGYGDNEGILSTFPAIATTLLGVLAGHWLRSGQSPWRKVGGLVLAGILSLLIGWLWSYRFPIIKNIWTSSFVLVAGGWSLILLGLFNAVVDVLRFRRWAFFFVVIGANSILIYLLPDFVQSGVEYFVGDAIEHLPALQAVLFWVTILGLEWGLLLFLYRKRIFLRV